MAFVARASLQRDRIDPREGRFLRELARALPGRALDDWLAVSGIKEGVIFELSDKRVARIVKARAKAAGLDAELFSGHSLSAAFSTTAAKKGRSLDAIMKQVGHRSQRIARGYIRHATAFDGNAAVGLL